MIALPQDAKLQDRSPSPLAGRLETCFAKRVLSGLRQIHISVDDEAQTVVLRGTVPSLYERRLADELCRRVAIGFRVVNLLDASELSERWSRD
jgi:hypothetical protein